MGPTAGRRTAGAHAAASGGASAAPTASHPPAPVSAEPAKPDRSRFALAIVSLALGIPLTAIATRTSGVIGLILTWVGIVAVNAVYGWTGRSHS